MSWNYIVAKFSILHVFWRKDLFSSQNMLKFKKYENLVLNFSIEKKNLRKMNKNVSAWDRTRDLTRVKRT